MSRVTDPSGQPPGPARRLDPPRVGLGVAGLALAGIGLPSALQSDDLGRLLGRGGPSGPPGLGALFRLPVYLLGSCCGGLFGVGLMIVGLCLSLSVFVVWPWRRGPAG